MDVRWWTSVVAYLPQQADAHAAREKAVLAGEAWRLLHQADEEDEDGDEGESGERDIWEERYNASNLMYSRDGGKGANHELPDWDIVRSETKTPPPFFAVEVEELPRGSGVEWNAVLGVTGGPVVVCLSSDTNMVMLTGIDSNQRGGRALGRTSVCCWGYDTDCGDAVSSRWSYCG